jgi:hypothetical protein
MLRQREGDWSFISSLVNGAHGIGTEPICGIRATFRRRGAVANACTFEPDISASFPLRYTLSSLKKVSEGSCGKDWSDLKATFRVFQRLATDRRTSIKPARSSLGRGPATWIEIGRGDERSIQAFVEDK